MVEICGIEFDEPRKSDLNKWDYREWKESKSRYREVWLDSYQKIDNAVCRMSYPLVSKNGSSFFLEDKRLKGTDEENAKKIFSRIDEGL